MNERHEADLFAWIVIALIIIASALALVRIVPVILTQAPLSAGGKILFGSSLLVAAVGVAIVLSQKWKREEKETFRRDKW
ncbi:MAG: hypothetical protein K9M49_06160 [Candidatus Marinimicrobia bacterium]|nr:hypothetical protein [Candidatus Neomarinimicrobiota bacterium]MCF7850059.1 hypothetical protein [Candidatus Neomarinimicrobiota bacterium]MCF7904719.1 hypothetical protein [Candidatus Neomarinimicrobiota bacterium]